MYRSFLIHLPDDGHLCCFHVLAIAKSAVMHTGVHVSLSILEPGGLQSMGSQRVNTTECVSLVCLPSSGITGSYGSSISSF